MHITKSRTANAQFDLAISDSMPEFFVDGLSHAMMGSVITKLVLHSVTEVPDQNNEIEQRKGVVRIAIPTVALLEMSRNILASAQLSIDALSNNGHKIDAQVKNIMNTVSIAIQTE